ncbi:sphingolipid delta(4)-desaturase DES1-like [Panonychus citri]|uniref:sphingolipid delta(4)-desaturase DES1-like n=1 Tax=Panonychus citri TaxID=50023 RepID=UPI0023083107|nr:sphingolipid delta(4)-desaturase DES1-like [Panonychus citri]XP_053213251.1 sphingolipid delta(4)-desaturase DES1-like [Panonychus citri]
MGAKVSRDNYEWVGSDEPHATRRKLILAKYPQIKNLMKVDPNFKWIVLSLVMIQIITVILLRNVTSWLILFPLCYFITGTINHALMLAVHEIAHSQAFGPNRVLANRIFGMIANLPLGVPMSVSFKKYHLEHHRYQGDDILDTDIPSKFEARFFTTTFLKVIWVMLQPFFYTMRPLFVHPKQPTSHEFINLAFQLTFDIIIGLTCGWHLVFYLILANIISMGLHPVAGHFISEHYIMFDREKVKMDETSSVTQNGGKFFIPETCSYYGILNYLTFNVGYHVEHHDFPSIPGSKLPLVRQIAPEFYNHLHHHTSWVKVIYQYIIDPSVGPFARVKRPHKFGTTQVETNDDAQIIKNGSITKNHHDNNPIDKKHS